MSEEEVQIGIPRSAACTDCERLFRYGELAIRPNKSHSILCENCARRDKAAGQVVVFGGGKPSIVGRDRAQRNFKKLVRAAKKRRATGQ